MNYEEVTTCLKDFQKKHFTRPDIDVKAPEVLEFVRQLADLILGFKLTTLQLRELEVTMCRPEERTKFQNLTHLSVKLAKSKSIIQSLNADERISIVMPAYGENIRMMPRGNGEGEHPLGEDFIVEKSKQLTWLFNGADSTYNVFIVDDMSKMDPISSGEAAEEVIKKNNVKNFEVIYLEHGVKTKKGNSSFYDKALAGVEFPKNTKKAGAVYYGIAQAIEKFGFDKHVIIITDCDLSVDLGQIGNLVEPILRGDKVSGAGSRRLPESILEIAGNRNLRANTARYFRQLLLPGLLPKDTQCGAKAFSAKALEGVLMADRKVLDFAFDIELFTLIALQNGPEKIEPVAVAWFDSAELTTTDSSVHYGIMKAQLAIAKANKTGSGPIFESLVEVSEIVTSSEEVWLKLLSELESRPELVEAMQVFDTSILDQLKQLVL